jgi:3'-5' exoribonuclease
MKSQYVDELKAGHVVKESFLLSKKIIKEKRDGGAYAVLEFSDRTGTIEGIAWDNVVESLGKVSVGDVVFISGNVNEYNEKIQIVVSSVRLLSEKDIEPRDFLRQSDADIDQVMAKIDGFRARVKNEHLKQLLDLFFEDAEFAEKFRTAPAAKRVHHAYLGGLAVHTLHVLQFLEHAQKIYECAHGDLLITGGILHDVGKIDEYSYTKKIDVTTSGKMLGHIMIGYKAVADKIGMIPEFPEILKLKLLHMLVSHHGEYQWGSPKQPMFLEALILHFVDNLDAKAEMMIDELRKNKEHARDWSDYHPFLEREIYLREEL